MKVLKKITLLLSILFVASCNNEIIPGNEIIPKDTMAMVIADIHIADATLNVIMNSEKFKEVDGYYKSVLDLHNISRARFDTSIAYYTNKPEVFSVIYEDVMFIISQKEGNILALPNDKKAEVKQNNKYEELISIKSNFDEANSNNAFLDKKSDLNSLSGKYSIYFKTTNKLSNKFGSKIENTQELKLEMKFMLKMQSTEKDKFPLLIIEVIENGQRVLFEKIDIAKYVFTKNEWNKIEINNNFKVKKMVSKGDVKIYLSNVFNQEFFIDDFEMVLKGK